MLLYMHRVSADIAASAHSAAHQAKCNTAAKEEDGMALQVSHDTRVIVVVGTTQLAVNSARMQNSNELLRDDSRIQAWVRRTFTTALLMLICIW